MDVLDESRSMSGQPHHEQCRRDLLVVTAGMTNTGIRREALHLLGYFFQSNQDKILLILIVSGRQVIEMISEYLQ